MRILLCTDGSPHGQAALRYGALLARASPEPATLLGVVEQKAERPQIEGALQEGERWLAGGPPPRTVVREGHAAEQILAEAGEGGYELVVVGARGRRGITRFLLGSTSERVARHAQQSVLIVQGKQERLARVLVCTAGGEPGLSVVAVGGRVARLAGAQVTVLHVMSQLAATPVLPEARPLQVMPQTPTPPETSRLHLEDLDARAEELMDHQTPEGRHLQEALAILAEMEVPARAQVRHGLVVDEIQAEACDAGHDLLVIGAHAAAGWMRFLLDDVVHQLLVCVDRPVLVARTG